MLASLSSGKFLKTNTANYLFGRQTLPTWAVGTCSTARHIKHRFVLWCPFSQIPSSLPHLRYLIPSSLSSLCQLACRLNGIFGIRISDDSSEPQTVLFTAWQTRWWTSSLFGFHLEPPKFRNVQNKNPDPPPDRHENLIVWDVPSREYSLSVTWQVISSPLQTTGDSSMESNLLDCQLVGLLSISWETIWSRVLD